MPVPETNTTDAGVTPDVLLLERLKAGDQAAFSEIYLRYYSRLYTYLLKFTKNPALAQDLLQNVFLKVWDKRAELSITGSLAAYLYRFARNKAIGQLEQIAVHTSIQEEIYHRLSNDLQAPRLANELDWQHYQRLLQEALASLTPPRRQTFILCREQGKSYEEAAIAMNISRHTIKEHLVLAVKQIKQYLLKHGEISLLWLLLLIR